MLCDFLFINSYMPCEDGSIESLNLLHEIIANIDSIVEQSSAKYVVFGGDF